MMLKILTLAALTLATLKPAYADYCRNGTYALELRFNFSYPTKAFSQYKGEIDGHVAQFTDLKTSFTLADAVARTQKLIGSNYAETIQVYVKPEGGHCPAGSSAVGPIRRPHCIKEMSGAKIVGADILCKQGPSAYTPLCKVGDSLSSGLKPCKGSFVSNSPDDDH